MCAGLPQVRAGERASKTSPVAATAVAIVATATDTVVAAIAIASERVRAEGEGGRRRGQESAGGGLRGLFGTLLSLAWAF